MRPKKDNEVMSAKKTKKPETEVVLTIDQEGAAVQYDVHDKRDRYINREYSWVAFNERVLDQAKDLRHPLLERVRFLAIFANNLHEFWMVRVGGLTALALEHVEERAIDGRTPTQQLHGIKRRLEATLREQERIWREELEPALEAEQITILEPEAWDDDIRAYLTDYFEREIFPILTPLAVDPGRPFPHISNLSLNLALQVELNPETTRFARLKIPTSVPRMVLLPRERHDSPYRFVRIEALVKENLDALFPGVRILSAHSFRLVRDADQPLAEHEANDLLMAMERHLRRRHFGRVVRLELEDGMSEQVRQMLIENTGATANAAVTMTMALDWTSLFDLISQVNKPELKYRSYTPAMPVVFQEDVEHSFFARLRMGDRLVHHPYDSFDPVLELLRHAARDPRVVAIKQTLYRVGSHAPVVKALLEARRAGKQVAAMVELKARFDEESNIEWAKTLEEEGVHVLYGLIGLKTHAKVTLVVRRESAGLRRYVHIGTGNYNAGTARIYTDLGLFTARPEVGEDASQLFNYLTGFSAYSRYTALSVAPHGLRHDLTQLIQRERDLALDGRPAELFFKMNSLTDGEIIDHLYEASQAGVQIKLIVRGACCLRPGVPGMSDNIEVRSVVGRLLEHSRIYYFGNDGNAEILMGSADLMGRNIDRRVEVLVRVAEEAHKEYLHDVVLASCWNDTINNYELQPTGDYIDRKDETPALDSHRFLMDWHTLAAIKPPVMDED